MSDPTKFQQAIRHVTPSNVLKWTGVIFLMFVMVAAALTIILTMVAAFS